MLKRSSLPDYSWFLVLRPSLIYFYHRGERAPNASPAETTAGRGQVVVHEGWLGRVLLLFLYSDIFAWSGAGQLPVSTTLHLKHFR